MDEPAVFREVVSTLDKRGYECLVHYPAAHSSDYAEITDSVSRHQITIAGRYPDIIGYTPSDAVFAVEVKGDSDLLKGIGQAFTYRRGCHQTYLAAPENVLAGEIDHLIGQGIGGLSVSSAGDIDWHDPQGSVVPTELADIEGRLTYQLRQTTVTDSVSTIALAQPLNFIAPAMAISQNGVSSEEELETILDTKFGFKATDYALQGSQMLNLVRKSPFRITNQGRMALTTFGGVGVQTLEDLAALKSRVRGSVVAKEEAALGTLLRTLYRQHPDFRLLIDALKTLDSPFILPELLEHLIKYYPNVYLNLICRQKSRNQARKLIEEGERDRLYAERSTWLEMLHSNIISNFVQQLKHIGVLAPETIGYAGRLSEYKPAEIPWILDDGFVSE